MVAAIIPKPEKITILPGEIHLASPISISGEGGAERILIHFASIFEQFFDFIPSNPAAQVFLELDDDMLNDLGWEGYRIDVSTNRITIRAAEYAGLFYGMQTLQQPEITGCPVL
jgi:hexosaminidase